MTEYKPLEICPALVWIVAQVGVNPKALEVTYADLMDAMPDELKTDRALNQQEMLIFALTFDDPVMREFMRAFWQKRRERKVEGVIPHVESAAWEP